MAVSFLWVILLLAPVQTTLTFLLEDGAVDSVALGAPFDTGFTNCGGIACPTEDGTCVDGKCRCEHHRETGLGGLACFHPRFEVCTIANDPSVRNFQGEFYGIPTPCRFIAVGARRFFPSRFFWTMRCSTGVDAFNERIGGKFFVGGFVARFYISRADEQDIVIAFRGNGIVDINTETYKFERRIRINNDPWKDLDDPTVDTAGIAYSFEVNDTRKMMELTVGICGLELYYRPPDPTVGQYQDRLPGLTIGIDVESGVTAWTEPESSACLAPASAGYASMGEIAAEYSLPSLTSAASYVAWLYTAQKNSRVLPAQCKKTAAVVRSCNPGRRSLGFTHCLSLLTQSIFVRCFSHEDPTQISILTLFKACLIAFCDSDFPLCEYVQEYSTLACGHRDLSQIEILNFDCTQFIA